MNNEDLEKAIDLLKQIKTISHNQLSEFKSRYNDLTPPSIKDDYEWRQEVVYGINILSDPLCFLFQNVEQYWELYSRVLDSIQNPLVQFSLRTLMEMSYGRVIYYSELSEEEQSDIALKFWLCTTALIMPSGSAFREVSEKREEYDFLLSRLSKQNDIDFFNDLRASDFPAEKIHSVMHSLIPSILGFGDGSSYLDTINRYVGLTANDRGILRVQYRYFSMLPHGNHVMIMQLGKEDDHYLRTLKILQLSSGAVVRYLHNKADLRVDIEDFEKIQTECSNILEETFEKKYKKN